VSHAFIASGARVERRSLSHFALARLERQIYFCAPRDTPRGEGKRGDGVMAKKAKQTKKADRRNLAIKVSDLPTKAAADVKGGKTRITVT
jgi:hypothetical protein